MWLTTVTFRKPFVIKMAQKNSKSNGNIYTTKPPEDDVSHQMISSLFLGPHAENFDYFKDNIIAVLELTKAARENYFPEDGVSSSTVQFRHSPILSSSMMCLKLTYKTQNLQSFIPDEVRASTTFVKNSQKISNAVQKAAELLGKHSVPWWSPRYAAHMCMDMSMPSLLGYFMTMLYNPNNVSIEASPFTMVAEIQAGQQLCDLFGYNLDEQRNDVPCGWGHITCGGTVANLESIW